MLTRSAGQGRGGVSLLTWVPDRLPRRGPAARQFTAIRRGKASFAFGNVSASTPSSTRAVIASRSILFDSVNVRE